MATSKNKGQPDYGFSGKESFRIGDTLYNIPELVRRLNARATGATIHHVNNATTSLAGHLAAAQRDNLSAEDIREHATALYGEVTRALAFIKEADRSAPKPWNQAGRFYRPHDTGDGAHYADIMDRARAAREKAYRPPDPAARENRQVPDAPSPAQDAALTQRILEKTKRSECAALALVRSDGKAAVPPEKVLEKSAAVVFFDATRDIQTAFEAAVKALPDDPAARYHTVPVACSARGGTENSAFEKILGQVDQGRTPVVAGDALKSLAGGIETAKSAPSGDFTYRVCGLAWLANDEAPPHKAGRPMQFADREDKFGSMINSPENAGAVRRGDRPVVCVWNVKPCSQEISKSLASLCSDLKDGDAIRLGPIAQPSFPKGSYDADTSRMCSHNMGAMADFRRKMLQQSSGPQKPAGPRSNKVDGLAGPADLAG